MKELLLPIMLVGVLLLGACETTTTVPEAEVPPVEESAPATYVLNVSVNPSGAGSVSPSGGEYEEGAQLTLTATPASGYTFDYWDSDASSSAIAISITMDSDKDIIANFVDNTPPVISDVDISHITESDATINWVTDEPATSQMEHGQTDGYGLNSALDEELTTNHSLTLTGLTADTTYHFRVESADASGNISISEDSTFTTKTVEELLETWVYPAMTIGDFVHQLGYGLLNGSSQTITVTKVEFFDENGSITHTVSESTIQGTSHKGQLLSENSFNWSLTFATPYSTEEIEGWTIKWYCLDANGVQFTVEGEYSSSLLPQ